MKLVNGLMLLTLIFITYVIVIDESKQPDYVNTDDWPEYYQDLAEQCKYLGMYSCCISSVNIMKDNFYLQAVDDICDSGYQVNMLKCITSFKWCEPKSSCTEDDWNCLCAKNQDEYSCNVLADCEWTNYKSDNFYCMERFCMDYTKEECTKHPRCAWILDNNAGYEYCEAHQYLDKETRTIIEE